ncbi:MAG: fibronectin type III domain-containing protein [Eubacterium sp.]|nr:fibronectin type III domain-containing protein [Eubacterium sp.]
MKKKLSALFMMFAVAFSVMLISGTTSKALSTWNANIQQTDASESSVKLQWEAYLGADHYEVFFSYDNNNWQSMDKTNSTSTTVYGLTPGSTYYVKVIAYSGYSWSDARTPLAESASSLDVVTSPAKVTGLKQTGATTTSITMGWTAVQGASGYAVYRYNSYDNYTLLGTTKTTGFTVKNLTPSSSAYYFVVAMRTNSLGQSAAGTYFDRLTMKTAPSKVSYVSMTSYYSALGSCDYGWNTVNNADGYEFQLLNYKGAKLLDKETTSSSIYINPFKKGVFTKARCRAYILVDNKRVYGAWSGYNYNASCKSVKVKRSPNRKKIFLKWSKIKGASGYQIYVSTKFNSGYKKIKSLKASKTSYSFTKFNKKSLKKNQTYYIRVKYLTKVGKKTVASAIKGQGSI